MSFAQLDRDLEEFENKSKEGISLWEEHVRYSMKSKGQTWLDKVTDDIEKIVKEIMKKLRKLRESLFY